MNILSLALAIVLGWPTFAGSPGRTASTATQAWPPFTNSWSLNLGPPGTRVFCPSAFEGYRICKYILRNNGHSLNVKAFDGNGRQLWHFAQELALDPKFTIKANDWQGAPTISMNCVYFTGTRKLYCLALETGSLLWEFEYPIKKDSDMSTVNPLAIGDRGFSRIVVAFEEKVRFHDAIKGILLKTDDNVSSPVPPAKLAGESVISPLHTDFAGVPLAQLPKEAFRVKGGLSTENDLVVGYYLNARWKAWKLDRLYNRWEKAWEVADEEKGDTPFWSFRMASMTKDRIILSMPERIVCVDYNGQQIWSRRTGLARWNMYAPVAGNAVLVTDYVHTRSIEAIDIRDGLSYPIEDLPVMIQAPPVPTDDGFMVMTSGGGIWAFKSSPPPKADVWMRKSLTISREWKGYGLSFKVANKGGSRMTFDVLADGKPLAAMQRCNPGESRDYVLSIDDPRHGKKVTVSVEGDGGRDWAICHLSVTDGDPDRRDVNLDGKVDFVDAFTIMQNMGKQAFGKPWEIAPRCDINSDGRISLMDAALWSMAK